MRALGTYTDDADMATSDDKYIIALYDNMDIDQTDTSVMFKTVEH